MQDDLLTVISAPIAACLGFAQFCWSRFAPQMSFKPRIWADLLLTISFLSFGICAQGAQVRTIITGALTGGSDGSGTFFAPGTQLAGKPYVLVYEMDDTKGVPYLGTWPKDCNNGLQNSGFNTPVLNAVLRISGSANSYTFGKLTPNSISSYVYSANYTSPQTVLYQRIAGSFGGASNLLGSESVQVEIDLNSISKFRSWESEFAYKLTAKDTAPSVIGVGLTNATTLAPVQNFSGNMNVANVNVSGPIPASKTPRILFFDAAKEETTDITNTKVTVVVGQQIYLFAIAAGAPVQPNAWGVTGKPIGDYLAPHFNPVPKCVQLSDESPGCISETAPPVFNNDSTRFYWTAPGVYSVKYNSVSGFATATFSVLGPTNVKVVPDPSARAIITDLTPRCPGVTQKVKFVVWGLETDEIIPGKPFSPGISFLASADGPTKGVFQWEQLIIGGKFNRQYSDKTSSSKPAQTGLDNTVAYLYSATVSDPPIPNNYAYDAPAVSVNDASGKIVTNVAEILNGKMYLLWKPSLPDAIAVTLGYVRWNTNFGADLLTAITYADGTFNALVATTDYPIWSNVVQNCTDQ
jgi:hypothetical protein